MNGTDRLIRFILRVTGTAVLLAAPFVFLPRAWHAGIHEWLGLGAYPEGPVIDYLVRTVSTMYVLSGVFCWLVSYNVERYASLIAFLAGASIAFGLVATVVDFVNHLPWFWKWFEGPPAILWGIVVLALLARRRRRTA
jgi:MYXO-CTERM domain-containing protein